MTRANPMPLLALLALLALPGCASTPPQAAAAAPDLAAQAREVEAAERAFARTMADRDFEAFAGFVAEDAVFGSGERTARGKAAVLAQWKAYFEAPEAPFAWSPASVLVLGSGGLAQTKGPVTGPDGKPFLEFRSTWRLDPDGRWRVVFDDGTCLCARPGG